MTMNRSAKEPRVSRRVRDLTAALTRASTCGRGCAAVRMPPMVCPGAWEVRHGAARRWLAETRGFCVGPPMDPQFYGDLELDAGELLSYIDEVRRHRHGHHND